jgi:hypothetical protein
MAADETAVKAMPTQEGILVQSQADGSMYMTSNFAWVKITTAPLA